MFQSNFWHGLLNVVLFHFMFFSPLHHKNSFHVWIKFFSCFGLTFSYTDRQIIVEKMGKFCDFVGNVLSL